MQDRTIHARFTASSSTYDRHSHVQEQVANKLIEITAPLSDVDRILELGCGTGRLTQKVCLRYPNAAITAVDLSGAMIDQGKTNLGGNERIEWIVSDVCDYQTSEPFPLIVSSSALHWVTPIDLAFDAIDRAARPGSQIVLAMMLHDTLGELHDARLRVTPHKPPRSRLPTLADISDVSSRLGWLTHHRSQRVFTVRHASARELLAAIHQQGLTGGTVSQSHTPLNRGELASLIKDYDSSYRDSDDQVVASYQVGFLHCERV
ncbi:methyltransferase domain-containing protein [Aporhodopirellula aestuarii]|uniref:Methyltransferase domain-containing protein n=1 Tax=Aporhodopirellula aestuarii TaxID=2950107 RepID=A0ABT0UB68_9BACT|nr:methyltransferase domain-containing protein [Aporhodopirellula aestuarii]MCM2374254.1 methyltransferase domain-containing protein [Aporhodopirellula aestuarii]